MVVQRALLIGNSRWHWAERHQTQWRFDHTPPDQQRLGSEPLVWAAVGPIPAQLVDGPGRPRIQLQNIPLAGCPPWLGVDRALGAWEAWRREQRSGSTADRGLLLADAGTVLSLTLLDGGGRFQGAADPRPGPAAPQHGGRYDASSPGGASRPSSQRSSPLRRRRPWSAG